MRRVHPRHARHTVTVRTAAGGPGYSRTWSEPVEVRGVQVVTSTKVQAVDNPQGGLSTPPRAVGELLLRVNPSKAHPDLLSVFTPEAEVTFEDVTGWVTQTRPIRRHGRLVYLEVQAGPAPDTTGQWPTQDVDGARVRVPGLVPPSEGGP